MPMLRAGSLLSPARTAAERAVGPVSPSHEGRERVEVGARGSLRRQKPRRWRASGIPARMYPMAKKSRDDGLPPAELTQPPAPKETAQLPLPPVASRGALASA